MNGRSAFAAEAGIIQVFSLAVWTFHDLFFLDFLKTKMKGSLF
jgi:hypothetical protein